MCVLRPEGRQVCRVRPQPGQGRGGQYTQVREGLIAMDSALNQPPLKKDLLRRIELKKKTQKVQGPTE